MKQNKEKPYIVNVKKVVVTERLYNPKYGDDRVCICGHPYHRHFDSYEDNEAVGCKYCQCYDFKEAPPMPKTKNETGKSQVELLNEYHQKLEKDYRNNYKEHQ
jgi:hypothetical protein